MGIKYAIRSIGTPRPAGRLTMDFNTSYDLPLQLRGGDSVEVAIYNRIAAINRINYLVQKHIPNFDIRSKSVDYTKALDLELYKKYYVNESNNKKIDEEFCQRVAKTCIDMDKEEIKPVNQQEFKIAFQTSVFHPQPLPKIKKPFIKKFVDFLNKNKIKL